MNGSTSATACCFQLFATVSSTHWYEKLFFGSLRLFVLAVPPGDVGVVVGGGFPETLVLRPLHVLLRVRALEHLDKVNPLQARVPGNLVAQRQCSLGPLTLRKSFAFRGGLANEIVVQVLRHPDQDDRLVLDPVVFRRLEVAIDPEFRDRAHVVRGVRARGIMVCPHDCPFQIGAVFCLIESLHPVFEAPLAAVPVPIDEEGADPVLDRPLDLPIDHLRIPFIVPTEERLDLRQRRLHHVPLRPLVRAGIIECGNLQV